MKATDVLVQCLENEGVEYIFGIVGTETLDLADSLSKSTQIHYVNVRHEQGAAFMADVYGRLSNKAGVCLSTLGPGATNLLTGVASAQLDHSPVVALIGQAGVERQHPESHQYIDIVKLFEPATKWCTQIMEAQAIPAAIRKAFRVGKNGKARCCRADIAGKLCCPNDSEHCNKSDTYPRKWPVNGNNPGSCRAFSKIPKAVCYHRKWSNQTGCG